MRWIAAIALFLLVSCGKAESSSPPDPDDAAPVVSEPQPAPPAEEDPLSFEPQVDPSTIHTFDDKQLAIQNALSRRRERIENGRKVLNSAADKLWREFRNVEFNELIKLRASNPEAYTLWADAQQLQPLEARKPALEKLATEVPAIAQFRKNVREHPSAAALQEAVNKYNAVSAKADSVYKIEYQVIEDAFLNKEGP